MVSMTSVHPEASTSRPVNPRSKSASSVASCFPSRSSMSETVIEYVETFGRDP